MQYQPEQIPSVPAPQPPVQQSPQPVVLPPIPPEGPRIPWKAVALYGGGGLFVAAIAFGILFFVFRGRGIPRVEPGKEEIEPMTEAARSALGRRTFEEATSACASETDYEACVAEAAVRAATRALVPELCDEISDSSRRDQCIVEVALRRGDDRLCSRASAQSASYCTSIFQSERARSEGDIELCLAVADGLQRESCFQAIIATKDRAFCESLSESARERCLTEVLLRDAATNPELCNEFSDPAARESCKEEFAAAPPSDSDGDGIPDAEEAARGTNSENADTDGDGLSDGEEVTRWGTDPLNPDTDGDGFGDGTEVRAGYNPKGGGRLQ